MNKQHKLVIIIGSVREGRFGPAVASWVADQARTHGGSTSRSSTWQTSRSRCPCPRCRRSTPATATLARRGWRH